MENNAKRNVETTESPLFVRFLEGQRYPQVRTDVRAGFGWEPWPPHDETMKYPSDDDDWPTS